MKEQNMNRDELSDIDLKAADWITKEDRGLSSTEQSELDLWLTQSDEHDEAYAEQRWNWEEFDRLAGLHTTYGSSEDPNLLINDRFRFRKFLSLKNWPAISACVALLLLSFFTVSSLKNHTEKPASNRVADVLVERIQTRELDDGSVIQLNRGAEVEVAYSKTKRLIRLLKGEANFVVEKDRERPFYVEVGGVQLRAVGTEFNVRFQQYEVDVIVTEGIVSVRQQEQSENETLPSNEEAFIEVNQRVKVNLQTAAFSPMIETIDEVVMTHELMWKPVLIDFENVPLGEIVDEFNRRNPIKMVIVDSSVNATRLSSMFWSDNINGLIRLLESNFGIKAEWSEDGTIYLFNNS